MSNINPPGRWSDYEGYVRGGKLYINKYWESGRTRNVIIRINRQAFSKNMKKIFIASGINLTMKQTMKQK